MSLEAFVTLKEFRDSLANMSPPSMSPPLTALWHDARGNWHEAHRLVQDVDNANAAWVHAYLHRKEGNIENAVAARRAVRCMPLFRRPPIHPHQTPGTRRFVSAIYSWWSLPNSSIIIRSSGPMRRATRRAIVRTEDRPTT
jgi:hypothetical protein